MSRESCWFGSWAWILSSDQLVSCTYVMLEYNLSKPALLYMSGFHAELLPALPAVSFLRGLGLVQCLVATVLLTPVADNSKTEHSWLYRFVSSDRTKSHLASHIRHYLVPRAFVLSVFCFSPLFSIFLSQLFQINHTFVAFIQVLRKILIYPLCYINAHLIFWKS